MSYSNQQLSSLPFADVIGGPLKAAIEAQAQAAQMTVEFITTVGFEGDGNPFFDTDGNSKAAPKLGPLRTVEFDYSNQEPDGTLRNAKLKVPLLTVVPIPFLRIDEMTVDFTAKITEVESSSQVDKNVVKQKRKLGLKYKSFWSPVSVGFKASYSSKHSSTAATSSRYKTEYTVNVHVRAVQDDVPGGLSRVLDILEKSITDTERLDAPASGA